MIAPGVILARKMHGETQQGGSVRGWVINQYSHPENNNPTAETERSGSEALSAALTVWL